MKINKDIFSEEIEKFVSEKKTTYMDAIIHLSERKEIEIESAAKMINKVIKQKLEMEASDNNLLKFKIHSLPF